MTGAMTEESQTGSKLVTAWWSLLGQCWILLRGRAHRAFPFVTYFFKSVLES